MQKMYSQRLETGLVVAIGSFLSHNSSWGCQTIARPHF